MDQKLLKENIIKNINNIGNELFINNKFNDIDNKKFVNLINHICYRYYKKEFSYGLNSDYYIISENLLFNSLFFNIKNNFYGNFLNKKIKYYKMITINSDNKYNFKKHYNISNSIFNFNYDYLHNNFSYFISRKNIHDAHFKGQLIDKIIATYSIYYKNISVDKVYFKNDKFYFNKYLIIK